MNCSTVYEGRHQAHNIKRQLLSICRSDIIWELKRWVRPLFTTNNFELIIQRSRLCQQNLSYWTSNHIGIKAANCNSSIADWLRNSNVPSLWLSFLITHYTILCSAHCTVRHNNLKWLQLRLESLKGKMTTNHLYSSFQII